MSYILLLIKIKMIWKIILILSFLLFNAFAFASIVDDQIIDEVTRSDWESRLENVNELNKNFQFNSFNSCSNMQEVLSWFLDKMPNYPVYRSTFWFRWEMVTDLMLESVSTTNSVADSSSSSTSSWLPSLDYSDTNIQVVWVDEPEIIKTDWKYIYYYNRELSKIYIVSWDVWEQWFRLDTVSIVKVINIPKSFHWVEIFINENRLIIISNRQHNSNQSVIDRNIRTTVVVYNLEDINNLVFEKMFDIDWYYFDSRLIWDKLYVVSKVWFNSWWYINNREEVSINDLLPLKLDLSYDELSSNRSISWLPYSVSIDNVSCEDILYVLPSEESLSQWNMNLWFIITSIVDLWSLTTNPNTTVAFWDLSEIHMSNDSIYFISNFYTSYSYRCWPNDRCIMPFYNHWYNTLIHKFDLLPDSLSYKASTIIPWMPLNQYSMSQEWDFFRIVTKSWIPTLSTHLFILDENLNLYWNLQDIEPWEEFKSSRFIWDMLYLVTFEVIDPLFAIDISDKSKPKMVWELKIPWYSLYLHPYWKLNNWIQYLIWLWYDVEENQWWWTVNSWLQISLYKIDFNKNETVESRCWPIEHLKNQYADCVRTINPSNIRVDLLHNEIVGWKWSWSEALNNPRMFVWNDNKKEMLLPVLLQEEVENEICRFTRLPDWSVIDENCFNQSSNETTFAWIKWYTIDSNNWIKEFKSNDYLLRISWNKKDLSLNQWSFSNLNFRVGYIWNSYYSFNNKFINIWDNSTSIYLNY